MYPIMLCLRRRVYHEPAPLNYAGIIMLANLLESEAIGERVFILEKSNTRLYRIMANADLHSKCLC